MAAAAAQVTTAFQGATVAQIPWLRNTICHGQPKKGKNKTKQNTTILLLYCLCFKVVKLPSHIKIVLVILNDLAIKPKLFVQSPLKNCSLVGNLVPSVLK